MLSASSILGRNFDIMVAGIDGLVARQGVHARNLANVDTPGYQAQKLDFESHLQGAIDAGQGRGPVLASGSGLLPAGAGDSVSGHQQISRNFTPTTTGGPVDKAAEANAMMQDNIRYRVLIQQVTNKINGLKGVISEMGRG